MLCTVTVRLREPASDMSREEILKQVAHVSGSLRTPRITPDGSELRFDVPAEEAGATKLNAEHLCALVQRSLRHVERKVVYRTKAMSHPVFRGAVAPAGGVHKAGMGQVMLEGIPLRLFQYFDAALARWEQPWNPRQLITPTLIPTGVLARCGYFRSFPNTVTFACHLQPEASVINAFRARHQDKSNVDAEVLTDMAPPEACLSPAVCYHVYSRYQGTQLPPTGIVHSVRGKCFRYEASNLRELTRLWDFTMRELVFMGRQDDVRRHRQRCVESVGAFFDRLGLAAEIRTASDPFFVAPDSLSKTYFQLTAETKYEISALLPGGERLAVGSINYHTDFFGRAFDVRVGGEGPMHSACVAFGLERLVHAFLAQQGNEPAAWPPKIKSCVLNGNPESADQVKRRPHRLRRVAQ